MKRKREGERERMMPRHGGEEKRVEIKKEEGKRKKETKKVKRKNEWENK
jgi:hypothetical protein